MLVNLGTRPTPVSNHGHCMAKVIGEDRIFSRLRRKQDGQEFFDSKVSALENYEKASRNHCKTDGEDASGSSTSAGCYNAMGNANNKNQPTWSCSARDGLDERPSNHTESPSKVTKGSSFEIGSKKMDSQETSISPSPCGTGSVKGEHSEFSVEQAESSDAKAATIQVDDHPSYLQNPAKILEPDMKAESRKLASEDGKCSEHKVELGNFGGITEPKRGGPASQLQPIDHREKSDLLEVEVRVCDICGDVGREELLAICTKCSDGAEHTYCMRLKLEKVPDGDWICEDCMHMEEKGKHSEPMLKQDFAARSKAPPKSRLRQRLGSLGVGKNKNRFKMDKTRIADRRRIRDSSPCFSGKRPFSCTIAVSQKETRGGPETSTLIKQTKVYPDTVTSQATSSNNLEKRETMSNNEGAASGLLLRTKSASNISTGVNFQQGHVGEKQDESRKEGARKMLFKSATFNHTTSNVRKLPSNLPIVEDLKRQRHEEEQIYTVPSYTSSPRSRTASNSDCTLVDNKTIPKCKTSLPILSEPVPSSSPTPAIGFADRDLENKDRNKILGEVIQKPCSTPEVMFATEDKNSFGALAFGEQSHMKGLCQSNLKNSTSWMPAVPECNDIWQGRFVIKKRGKPASSCDGVQAHLSSMASPKVHQIVRQCPPTILLEEVSCLDKWPEKSTEKHLEEDNIAVYFFAKDLGSYEKNYKCLLDYLVKNDLCLKGDINGVELLIFASNLLPERSQCWKSSLFFWGILKERIPNCFHSLPMAPEGIRNSSFGSAPSDSHNSCSSVHSSEILSCSFNVRRDSNSSISSKAAVSAPAMVDDQDRITSHPKGVNSATSDGRLNAQFMHQKPSWERDLKRRLGIDLNVRSDASGTREFGEAHKCRKIAISKESLELDGYRDANILRDSCVLGFGCSHNGEESYGTFCKSGWINSREHEIPSLELSLGWSEYKPAEQGGAMKLFPGSENSGCFDPTDDVNDEPLLSLSLSLSTSYNQQASERTEGMRSLWPSFDCVDTSLSLSSGL